MKFSSFARVFQKAELEKSRETVIVVGRFLTRSGRHHRGSAWSHEAGLIIDVRQTRRSVTRQSARALISSH